MRSEKEKEENVRRRKISVLWRRRKRRKKRRKIFGEGKFVEEKEKKEHIIETEKLLRVDGTGLKGSLRNL